MLCFLLRLFNVPALAVGLVLYYTLSLESINLIPNPKYREHLDSTGIHLSTDLSQVSFKLNLEITLWQNP